MKRQGLSESRIKGITKAGRYGDGWGGYGLSLLVKERARGGLSHSFSQRLRVQGKVITIGLGPWPLVKLAEARDISFDNARAARQGVDPRQAKVTIPTFEDVATAYMDDNAASWTPATARRWRNTLRDYAYPIIGTRPVDTLTTPDMVLVLNPIWTTKHKTAAAVKQRLHVVMDLAKAQGHIILNPVDGVEAALPRFNGKTKHHAAMRASDIPTMLVTLRQSAGWAGARDAIEFLILTGARSAEVTGMTWSEIDGDTWTIPASRTKTRTEHVIPLSRAAVQVLKRAEMYKDTSGRVFPSERGKTLSDVTLGRVLKSVAPGVTCHGFRSTLTDWATEQGVAPEVTDRALGHVVKGVRAAYDRTTLLDLRRDLMDDWGKFVTTT